MKEVRGESGSTRSSGGYGIKGASDWYYGSVVAGVGASAGAAGANFVSDGFGAVASAAVLKCCSRYI